jgi:PhoH-like ATPase
VVIPITLLEEIDKFKRGNEIINYNAREFARELDSLLAESALEDGVVLEGGGCIFVRADVVRDEYIKSIFWEDSPDPPDSRARV